MLPQRASCDTNNRSNQLHFNLMSNRDTIGIIPLIIDIKIANINLHLFILRINLIVYIINLKFFLIFPMFLPNTNFVIYQKWRSTFMFVLRLLLAIYSVLERNVVVAFTLFPVRYAPSVPQPQPQ